MRNKVNVPIVLQMENAECGAASLAMVLRYFGNKNISLEQLRVDCNVSRDGVNAKGIKRAAIKNGLVCKAFKATPQNIKSVSMPAIIHWNMGHFVVLCGYSKNCYYINDPAIGKYKVSYEEFDRSFTGIVLVFEKSEEWKTDKSIENYQSFTLGCIKKAVPKLIFISFLIMLITVFSMILPFFNSAYIDNILLTGNMENFAIIAVSMFVVIIFSLTSSILVPKLSYNVEKYINIKLSLGFMEKILKLPIVFFNQRNPGELANRQLGSFEIAQLVMNYITPIFFQSALIVLYCIAAFMFNVYIALIGIIAIVLNIVVVIYASKGMSSISAIERKNTGLYQGGLASAIDMIETIKSCSVEDAIFAKLAGIDALNIETGQKSEKINVYSSGVFYFINLLVSASILVVGAYEILQGEFSVGLAVGIIGLVSAFLAPIGSFINSISTLFSLKSIADRTDDTMKYGDEDIFLPDDKEQTKQMNGSVMAKNVYFRYASAGNYILNDVSFNLEKGKSVAFVGKSGSGKSTIAKLIAGLYSENEGNIYYGESTKKELKKSYFYSKIAVISQDAKLYDGTIYENISMWDSSITYDDVVLACKKACIHSDIVTRNNAYFEKITEGGKNFSGGQRQRMEIARAIARKPEILILDEATSALDAETEKKVMQNISDLGITLVIIAHRLSTIRNCDEIIVFDNGSIIERGSHNELVGQKGYYYNLVSDIGE